MKLLANTLLIVLVAITGTRADDAPRDTPYSVVYYGLTADEAQARRQLQTVRDLGCSRVHTLVYWWQADTRGGDYWKTDYSPDFIGDNNVRAVDLFVNISNELGMKPSLRLGSFREFDGKFHPMDESLTAEHYAAWVTQLARRHAGKVDHYIIGDEENRAGPGGFDGTPRAYLETMLIPLSKAIRAGDPSARISICGVSSAPATKWVLELIDLGLPKHADGVAGNYWHAQIDDFAEAEDFMKRVRAKWPAVKFYSNGMVYAPHRALNDRQQAASVAQAMFTLFDRGWDSAPYYLYTFSVTVDTRENYGLCTMPTATEPGTFSDAWKAYQTIARTFYDRTIMKRVERTVTLTPLDEVKVADGTALSLSPPAPVCRAYQTNDGRLLIYLAYDNPAFPREGEWRIMIAGNWGKAEIIDPLQFDRRQSVQLRHGGEGAVIDSVRVNDMPTIIELTNP